MKSFLQHLGANLAAVAIALVCWVIVASAMLGLVCAVVAWAAVMSTVGLVVVIASAPVAAWWWWVDTMAWRARCQAQRADVLHARDSVASTQRFGSFRGPNAMRGQ